MEINMPASVYFFLMIELLAVTYFDLIQKKIANVWVLINLVSYVLLLILMSSIYKFALSSFVYSFTFLIVGLILFSLKLLGAGDSKYLFSLFLIVPEGYQESFFISLLYSTIIVGVIFFSLNIIKNYVYIVTSIREKKYQMLKKIFGKKFSFAPVILLAWIWFGLQNKEFFF